MIVVALWKKRKEYRHADQGDRLEPTDDKSDIADDLGSEPQWIQYERCHKHPCVNPGSYPETSSNLRKVSPGLNLCRLIFIYFSSR
jgi:hypothetical protein